jgi:co-chaperonin GroES (HSP10)
MLRPIRDRVIVKPLKPESTLILGDDQSGIVQGKVVAHGAGRRLESGIKPMSVQVGDRILYPAACGQEIAGSDLLVMTDDDILAVIS